MNTTRPTRRDLLQLSAGGALLGLTAPALAQESRPVAVPKQGLVVYAVRHAEKQGGDDPGLTAEGVARAAALAFALRHVPLDGVYSTDTKRTRATVAPAAEAHGLEVQTYAADGSLSKRLGSGQGGRCVLVVGHSNTIPALLQRLGLTPPEKILSGYEDLFQVVAFGEQRLLQRLSYGGKSQAKGH
ncbi:MAG TPA: histidine phosphatase family protein [Planctomycetes bacterium]|nr:histidine phosphatase family protein [Planctomycetota bacterium]|tara:strand:+ start:64 stop:621 length:558 start_codon:yes stop_codon:yes gene_type:complete